MPQTTGLSADKLRELARVGAETALKHLRAEIIAIELIHGCSSPRRSTPRALP
jgi:hypothetical protein